MNRLPLTVISGYLGAGKTTLINRMLAEPQGLRLMVMVNDFGAINIDAALIARQSEDVIALTNGCVCCTMGADLFMAIGDVLDRPERPDHLIIEASGIADPKAIANAAIAEPDLIYAGIVTLVDALNIKSLLGDPLVGPQVRQQIAAADLVVLTKKPAPDADVRHLFEAHRLPLPVPLSGNAISVLTLDGSLVPAVQQEEGHADFVAWQHRSDLVLERHALERGLAARPAGLYRLKGFVRTAQGSLEVHVVGKHMAITPAPASDKTLLVGLGAAEAISLARIEGWWDGIARPAAPPGDRHALSVPPL